MPSKLKSDTARANGAKSRGPKSAATREISRGLAPISRYTCRLPSNHEKTRRRLRELQKDRGKTFGPACASPEPPPAISSPDSVQPSEPIQTPPAAQTPAVDPPQAAQL